MLIFFFIKCSGKTRTYKNVFLDDTQCITKKSDLATYYRYVLSALKFRDNFDNLYIISRHKEPVEFKVEDILKCLDLSEECYVHYINMNDNKHKTPNDELDAYLNLFKEKWIRTMVPKDIADDILNGFPNSTKEHEEAFYKWAKKFYGSIIEDFIDNHKI